MVRHFTYSSTLKSRKRKAKTNSCTLVLGTLLSHVTLPQRLELPTLCWNQPSLCGMPSSVSSMLLTIASYLSDQWRSSTITSRQSQRTRTQISCPSSTVHSSSALQSSGTGNRARKLLKKPLFTCHRRTRRSFGRPR